MCVCEEGGREGGGGGRGADTELKTKTPHVNVGNYIILYCIIKYCIILYYIILYCQKYYTPSPSVDSQ